MTDLPELINIDKPIVTGYPLADIHYVGDLLNRIGGGIGSPSQDPRARLLYNLGAWLAELEE